jgi:hypothetical protein
MVKIYFLKPDKYGQRHAKFKLTNFSLKTDIEFEASINGGAAQKAVINCTGINNSIGPKSGYALFGHLCVGGKQYNVNGILEGVEATVIAWYYTTD